MTGVVTSTESFFRTTRCGTYTGIDQWTFFFLFMAEILFRYLMFSFSYLCDFSHSFEMTGVVTSA